MAEKKVVKKYDWKKTAMKVGKNAVYVILAGLASVYGNNTYYLALAPLLVGVENYIKNR